MSFGSVVVVLIVYFVVKLVCGLVIEYECDGVGVVYVFLGS